MHVRVCMTDHAITYKHSFTRLGYLHGYDGFWETSVFMVIIILWRDIPTLISLVKWQKPSLSLTCFFSFPLCRWGTHSCEGEGMLLQVRGEVWNTTKGQCGPLMSVMLIWQKLIMGVVVWVSREVCRVSKVFGYRPKIWIKGDFLFTSSLPRNWTHDVPVVRQERVSMYERVMTRDYVEEFVVVPTLTCNLVKVSVSVISLRA